MHFRIYICGKILLFLEGLAGLAYSIPDNRLTVRDTMPTDWAWMEVRLPIRIPDQTSNQWPTVRFERSQRDGGITKKILHQYKFSVFLKSSIFIGPLKYRSRQLFRQNEVKRPLLKGLPKSRAAAKEEGLVPMTRFFNPKVSAGRPRKKATNAGRPAAENDVTPATCCAKQPR